MSTENPITTTASYNQARAALISEERGLRYDHQQEYIDKLGPSEAIQKAESIIRLIRREEESSIWAKETEEVPHIFPGMEFLTARETIEKTRLFELMKKLPKGALLHAHMDAMCDAQFLLSEARKYPQMHVRSPRIVSAETISSTVPQFSALPERYHKPPIANITSMNYQPDTWVPLSEARANFALGGPEGFDQWTLSAMRIDTNEAYNLFNTSKKIWQKFAATFGVAGGLLRFEPVLKAYFRELLRSSIQDGISYVEARINFFDRTMVRKNGENDFTHREWIISLEEAISDVKAELKSQGRENEFVGAKVIYTTLKFITLDELQWYLDDCIELKKEFPNVIAGFDLVGQEDTGHPLTYYLPKLLEFRQRVTELELNLPFIFHAGETLGDGDCADENLYDAILLGTKRIGHGFSLAKHPLLMKICRERGIAIEVCPISNEILRLTSSMPTHPLPVLLNNGVPVILASDDPAVFGNLGLSYDFFQVLVASEVTGLTTLAIMAIQSIEFSSLDDIEKEEAMIKWKIRWEIFIQDVLALEA